MWIPFQDEMVFMTSIFGDNLSARMKSGFCLDSHTLSKWWNSQPLDLVVFLGVCGWLALSRCLFFRPFVGAFLRTHHPWWEGAKLGFVVCAVAMSDVLMTGLDGGLCPYSCCVKQQGSNLIAFFALPSLDNCQQIEHLLEARDPTVRRLICELLPWFICVHTSALLTSNRLWTKKSKKVKRATKPKY